MTTLREAAQQALEAMRCAVPTGKITLYEWDKAVSDLNAALAEHDKKIVWVEERKAHWAEQLQLARETQERERQQREEAALAEPEGGGNLPPPLQLPAEVAATLTTTDIAWLATCRLTKLWQELGQMRWVGTDEGWDRAIEAVRYRLDKECQAVLDWKAKADQSQATAVELLRKMQGVKDD